MSQTVIGFFDDQSEARRALEQLQSRGISRERIDISRGSNAGSTSMGTSGSTGSRSSETTDVNPVSGSAKDENSVRRTADDHTVDRDGRNTNAITDFFNNLFGGRDKDKDDDDDDDDAARYSHVAQRSRAIVTVHAQSRQEAEAAAEIMDDCGAVDVDERASQSGYTRDSGYMGSRSNTSGQSGMTGGSNMGGQSSMGDQSNMGGQSNMPGNMNQNPGNRNSGMRSRIIDRRLDDDKRLRDSDMAF
jgi:hypothetical protein